MILKLRQIMTLELRQIMTLKLRQIMIKLRQIMTLKLRQIMTLKLRQIMTLELERIMTLVTTTQSLPMTGDQMRSCVLTTLFLHKMPHMKIRRTMTKDPRATTSKPKRLQRTSPS
ncbi:unnamed protein product [Durusdinium trenchii]|uniref:Uncharacterized protein n=1 Tax=Durusdinium trenchii TaxID=1381693 RepID=A0ABP0I2V5_9DINO